LFVKYLVVSNLKKSLIVDLLEKYDIEYDFIYENFLNNHFTANNKIIIFENIDIDIIYEIRQKNFLARFIFIKSKEYILEKEKASLCQFSAILDFPIDEKLFFEKIIKCDDEILMIHNEMFLKTDFFLEKDKNFQIDKKYTKNEEILLNFFLNNENILVSEDSILEYYKFYNVEITLKTLKNLLSNIRKKDKCLEIENIYGSGYRYKKNMLSVEFDNFIDLEYEKNIKSSKDFNLKVEISCSFLLNKLDIDRVCFMEYENDIVKILDEKVVYPQKKVLEQITSLEITTFHKKTILFSLKNEEPYIINFDDIVNLYFIFPKNFEGKIKAKSIVYFPFRYKSRLFSIGLHQNYSYRRWKESEIKLLKRVIATILKSS